MQITIKYDFIVIDLYDTYISPHLMIVSGIINLDFFPMERFLDNIKFSDAISSHHSCLCVLLFQAFGVFVELG